ncbi:hypothetical protein MUN76_04655 [Leucobacter rhizosphaerae]|uniref:DUF559 domain-containing protein n=1 Tax=Leucobacter rhizosphaerae TaxID=2932245 RepID=A0ABY4FY84_9MICO|nr:hypothetical protein [Leucobacter rhizosphaerae]UOQ61265.1 hypothetical protein MUN76_04655 [Leucobacter rhizosphaerae]
MSATEWSTLSPNDRLVARARAVNRAATREPLFTHTSAAALLGLPLFDVTTDSTHVASPVNGPGRSSGGLIRHRFDVQPEDITFRHHLRCTTPDRTVFDLARSARAEAGLSCADAVLRAQFRTHRSIDRTGIDAWRAQMRERVSESAGTRGLHTLRRVVDLADPRADSVLESISRLQFLRLGFNVDIQVPVPSPSGGHYFVDFELLGIGVLGECDGRSKYRSPLLRNGESAEEVVYREKRRHDWICGTTGKRMIRWGFAEATTPTRMARMLTAYGIAIPGGPSR